MRRVVVTGMGIVSPLGVGIAHNWRRLIAGEGGFGPITGFDVSDLPAKIAAHVPIGDGPGDFNSNALMSEKDRRRIGKFILFAMQAAQDAITDSGWQPESEEDLQATGVMVGSGIGGLEEIESSVKILEDRGPRRVSPFFIPSALINLASGNISIKYGFKGPNHSVVTACSTGAHAIGDAARIVAFGDADVMIAGGAEAGICRIGIAGFAACKALSTAYNETPNKASRPYDKGRDGFVMGEGAGVIVLEELEHARRRGAQIYGEFAGYGMSGDAYHLTAPPEDGNGGFRSMAMAVKSSGLSTNDIDYVNAHGTSTPLGDEIEVRAVRKLFGGNIDHMSMSSTKSAVGHLLGGAGAVEAIYSLMALKTQMVPPTRNLEDRSDGLDDIDLVPHVGKEREVRAVLSNSFGFGGTNASLIFKAPSP